MFKKILIGCLVLVGFCGSLIAAELTPEQHKGIYDIIDSDTYFSLDKEYDPDVSIEDYLKALDDKHAGYEPPVENKIDSNVAPTSQYKGYGIVFGKKDENILIREVYPGPAETAGIKRGYVITCFNGQDVIGMGVTEFVGIVRKSTSATFCLEKDDVTTKSNEVFPGEIRKKALYSHIIDDIIYIRITEFNEYVAFDFQNAIRAAKAKNPKYKAVIFDVRYNPGGLLSQAAALINMSYSGLDDVMVQTRNNKEEITGMFRSTVLSFIPKSKKVVVLMNKYSASASEVLASALRDLRAAQLVGEKSYGKGSVQTVFDIDGHVFKFTTARYFTRSNLLIDGIGLTPDVYIENPEGYAPDYLELPDISKDLQLKAAVRIINE